LLFRCRQFRFTLQAREPLVFPPGKAGNVLRGAFGLLFQRVAPQEYPLIFEPRGGTGAPSGLADSPRPFVFRSRHLDGRRFRPGERFEFAMNAFEEAAQYGELFAQAFALLAQEGLGPGRAAASLDDWQGVVRDVDLAAVPALPVEELRIRFETPTELKAGDGLVRRPEFGVLLSRVRDRVSTLRAQYGPGPLDLDFRAFGDRAGRVELVTAELSQVRLERRSSRTLQTHPIGGFTGEATYRGELTEFLPYLEAAVLTGVGRQTVWGKGEISLIR
jgi:hypothetical protein